MNNNKSSLQEFFKRNGGSIIICSSIAILLIATLYFSFNNLNKNSSEENLMAENESSLLESVNQSDVKSYKENENLDDSNDNENSTSKVEENQDNSNNDESSTEGTTSKVEENQDDSEKEVEETKETSLTEDSITFSLFDYTKEMTWPVFGQIVMDYSTETAIYDKTLEQYRTNDSISIKADEGTDVLAAAEGVVEQIYSDVEDGNTVVINHGNGWMSTYSQLQDNILVAVGQIVAEGEVIGKVGTPSIYTANLGSHLQFKVTKDNISTDPKLVLAEIDE